jgi:hypothetical protein
MTPDLTSDDLTLLRAALAGPVLDDDPETMGRCLRLSALHLLQRSGPVAAANGWRGSPHAFFLTREGWALMKAQRATAAVRRSA